MLTRSILMPTSCAVSLYDNAFAFCAFFLSDLRVDVNSLCFVFTMCECSTAQHCAQSTMILPLLPLLPSFGSTSGFRVLLMRR